MCKWCPVMSSDVKWCGIPVDCSTCALLLLYLCYFASTGWQTAARRSVWPEGEICVVLTQSWPCSLAFPNLNDRHKVFWILLCSLSFRLFFVNFIPFLNFLNRTPVSTPFYFWWFWRMPKKRDDLLGFNAFCLNFMYILKKYFPLISMPLLMQFLFIYFVLFLFSNNEQPKSRQGEIIHLDKLKQVR